VTLFEYLSVAISIVLSLSAAQLLGNLREVLDPARRYWVHALWVVQTLWLHVLYWWSMWAYRDVESWNLLSFAFVLLVPALLFMSSSALVPSYARSVSSWDEHFFAVRRWYFAARSLLVVFAGLRSWLLLDTAPPPFSGLILVACVTGFVFSHRWLHVVLVVATSVGMFGVAYARLKVGAA
jgi:hypothetical protein